MSCTTLRSHAPAASCILLLRVHRLLCCYPQNGQGHCLCRQDGEHLRAEVPVRCRLALLLSACARLQLLHPFSLRTVTQPQRDLLYCHADYLSENPGVRALASVGCKVVFDSVSAAAIMAL